MDEIVLWQCYPRCFERHASSLKNVNFAWAALSSSGEYRMNFDLGATTALTNWLNWNTALGDRYLNTPIIGRKANDVLYSTGFGFSFGR